MRRLIFTFIILILLFNGVKAQEVAGKYRIAYTNVTEHNDTLQLDFADTISNATVTFTAKGFANFDNANGGYWKKANKFVFTSALSEYAQYRIEINGSNWYLYNVMGGLEASLSDTEFWGLVQSDGDDIRVFNQSSQLYFWIEYFNATEQKAIIWVNISQGSSEVNIAYGNTNATASAYNNASHTFIYYDEGDRISEWTVVGTNTGQDTSVGNPAPSYKAESVRGDYLFRRVPGLTNRSVIEYDMMTTGLGNFYVLVNSTGYGQMYRLDSRSTYVGGTGATTSWTSWQSDENGDPNITANTWYHVKLVLNGTHLIGYVNGVQYGIRPLTEVPDNDYIGLVGDNLGAGYYSWWDNIKIYKYADPADVSSTSHYDLYVQNPRLILNGNVVEYAGNLTAGSSVTLNISSTYFVQGANNITITSDNKALMDVVIEFDYAFEAVVVANDYDTYYVKNSSVSIPYNTVSATYTFYLPKRTSDYKLSVLLNGANATYTKQDLPDSVKISLNLTPGNYTVNATIQYLLFNVSILDEVSLTPAKVNITILNSNYIKLREYVNTSTFKIYGSKDFSYGNYFMKLTSSPSKSIYERTVTLVAHKLNNTVKALVLDVNEPAVSVIFQLNDPYDIYSGQAIIRVSKYVNGQLYDVVSDKVDIENKISTILRYNDKYYISIIDWATGREQTIGDFIAASSGTKVINAKAVDFNVTTVFDYIKYSVSDTDNYIVVHYEDTSGKTKSVTVTIKDDKGNSLFHETSYQQKFDLVFNKTGAPYYVVSIKADTQYGLIQDTKIVGTVNGILAGIKNLLPGEKVTGFSQDFLMNVISFSALILLAGLFSRRNSRTGALAFAICAGLIWLFGWLPVSSAIIALIVVMAILGKLEEGYKK